MIEPKALDKLIENGISIISIKDRYNVDNADMVRDVRVNPDGRLSIKLRKYSSLVDILRPSDAFVLSVLMEGTAIRDYEDLFIRFDTICYRPGSEFVGLKCVERQPNGLYGITSLTNAIISCVADEIIKTDGGCQVVSRITDSKLLRDEPSLMDDFYRQHLRRHFTTHKCIRCDMLFGPAAAEGGCCNCGGDVYPVF